MTSIDDLIRETLTAGEDDAARVVALAAARERLCALTEAQTSCTRRRAAVWRRRLQIGAGLIPVVAVTAVVLVIAVGAVLLIHGRPAQRSSAAQPPSPAGLTSHLAVLRRPQATADKLPARVADHWSGLADQTEAGALVPNLTRLVFTNGKLRVYLAVVKPTSGPYNLWTTQEGDEVTAVAITPSNVTATRAIPAEGLTDAAIINPFGQTASIRQSHTHGQPHLIQGLPYLMSIVPDGVATVRWQYSQNTHGDAGHVFNVAVKNNVAVLHCTTMKMLATAYISPTWIAADGQRIPTNDRLINQALAASERRRFQQTLTTIRAQHNNASPQILKAFAVFSYTSQSGIRLSDGLVISKPSLNQIPLGVLEFGLPTSFRQPKLDFREARQVQAPSGVSVYIIPGPSSLCVITTGVFETHDPPALAAGAAGGCNPTIPRLLLHGSGGYSGGNHSQIDYGIVPTAHPSTTIPLFGGHHKTIHPEAGVYILRS